MNDSFAMLLREFASAQDLTIEPDANLLEFECDGLSIVVAPHPLHAENLMAEVSVIELDPDPPARQLALLLQVNEAARFEHDWSIVLDSEQQVSLYTTEPVIGMTSADVERLLTEGIDRALALQRLLDEVQDSAPDTAQAGTSDNALGAIPLQGIRG